MNFIAGILLYGYVYKDDIAIAVSNEFPKMKASITEYQKIDSRGDLTRKTEVLCTLAKRLEPFEKALGDAGFKSLCTDTTFLLNKVARHELKDKDKVDAKFKAMDDKTLEEWCDRTFKHFLGCMAVVPYVEMRHEINVLKKD